MSDATATRRRVGLVLGAKGTLGQALTAVLPQAGYDLRAALDRAGCDIADADAVRAVGRASTRPT